MKVALYARVSTRDKGQNPEMQLEPIRKYCQATGWNVYGEYTDKASAADLTRRKEWARLMADAAHHRFDILLIWKLDRAFRSVTHAANTIAMFNGYNVGFRSLMDSAIDTTNPNGMLVFNILAAVAQFEKDLTLLRVNEGISYAQEHGTKSGKPIGRRPHDIPLQTICNAVSAARGSYTGAARDLSESFNIKLTAGFVSLRLKRAGLNKEAVLQQTGTLQGTN
jgi:DNA invertase Pin-like site-specific DNA recombinase